MCVRCGHTLIVICVSCNIDYYEVIKCIDGYNRCRVRSVLASHLPTCYPAALQFRDYSRQIFVNWNWSFLPLDLAISATGLTSLWFSRKGLAPALGLMTISLSLTFVFGLQAISFWEFAQDFSVACWLASLFLMLYPLVFITRLIGSNEALRTITNMRRDL